MSELIKHKRYQLEKGKHLMVRKNVVSADFPLHWHSYFELEIIIKGKGKYVINDTVYDLSEKNAFLMVPTDFHCLEIDEEVELINISFDSEFLSEKFLSYLLFSKAQKGYQLREDDYERAFMASKLLQFEYESDGEMKSNLLECLLHYILNKRLHSYEDVMNDESLKGIKKAIIYLEMHFKETVTLDILAREAGYNPTYFSEIFHRITGESYIERLNRLRIGYARMLLSNGLSVGDACFLSGFSSMSNFLSVFKKKCGISPREYKTKPTCR